MFNGHSVHNILYYTYCIKYKMWFPGWDIISPPSLVDTPLIQHIHQKIQNLYFTQYRESQLITALNPFLCGIVVITWITLYSI